MSLSLNFINTTNQQRQRLWVGDNWQLSIKTFPTTDVYSSGGKIGENHYTKIGTTDLQGNLVLRGQLTSADIGNWSQQISATFQGRSYSQGLVFSVDNPPQQNTTSGGGSNTNTNNPPPLSSNENTIGSAVSKIFETVPVWVWAGVGLYLFWDKLGGSGEE